MKTMRAGMLLMAMVGLLFAGCATKPKIDWASRVGTYTFDEAVIDYGPPDKQSTLKDGTVVAEWLTQRGYRELYPVSPSHYHGNGYYNSYPPTYIDTSSPDYFLRLAFGPDGKLKTWRQFSR
jgi:hypothetical protein